MKVASVRNDVGSSLNNTAVKDERQDTLSCPLYIMLILPVTFATQNETKPHFPRAVRQS